MSGRQPDPAELQALLDRLMSADNILWEEVIPRLDGLQADVDALQGATDGDGSPPTSPILAEYPFEMSHEVPADTPENDPASVELVVPYDCWLVEVVLGWADGAQSAAGVRIEKQAGVQLVPRTGKEGQGEGEFLGANDFHHPYRINHRLDEGDTIVALFANLDASESHKVTVNPTLKERAEGIA